MPQCSNGHDSNWDDYCSECGVAIGAAASAAPESATEAPKTSGASCPNCSVGYADGDVFCENCGYDFLTGSLPEEQGAITQQPAAEITADPAPAPTSEPAAMEPLAIATVALDEGYFSLMSAEGLAFPDPVPPAAEVPITADETLIGRESRSRGIHPDIDLSYLGEDPGASSRHAMIRRDPDGNWTVEDLGSTNGTYLTRDGAALEAGTPAPIELGVPFFVGAWTAISLRSPGPQPD